MSVKLSQCSYKGSTYLEMGKRSLLAGRSAEANWFAQKAKTAKAGPEAFLLEGNAMIALGRYEEAIIALKRIDPNSRKYTEQAHLLLIKAYYLKANKTKDKNVLYLVSLFDKMYPDSDYQNLLKQWLQTS